MSRLLSLVVILGLAAGLYFLPGPEQPSPDTAPEQQPTAFAVCPVIEGGGRSTEVAVAAPRDGDAAITLFAGGATVGSLQIALGDDGATIMPVVDIAAVGTVGGLVELPDSNAAAGTRTRGAVSTTLEGCAWTIPAQVVAAGGSTVSGQEMTLHLMNPFAGDAVATLVVHSEAGLETHNRFNRVIVPSRGSNVIRLNDVIPGREQVTVRVEVTQGRIVAAVRQDVGDVAASWRAVEPQVSWLLPIPNGVDGRLVIGNAVPGEVEYQVDTYSPEGFVDSLVTGVLAEGEQALIPLAELGGARGVRVVASDAVVVSLQLAGETTLSATTAAETAATTWLLPAASNQAARLVVLNPDLEDAAILIRARREGVREFRATVPAEGVFEISLDPADAYSVESDVPVVALLYEAGPDDALAIGVPLEDG